MARTMPTGLRERHSRGCPADNGGRCSCKPGPSIEAHVFDRRANRKIRKTFVGEGARTAAKAWRADAVSALNRGTLRASTRRTLREEAVEWIDRLERGEILTKSNLPYKPSVARGYKADLENHVLPELGGAKVSEIRRRDVQRLLDDLRAPTKDRPKGLSGSKVRNVLVALKALYRVLLENDELTLNPTTGLRLPPPAGTRDRAVSATEGAELLAALPADQRPVWSTALYAGLRLGELLALRWEDVDLAGGKIRVWRSWDTKAGQIEPKSRKGTRTVPLTPTLRDTLAEHKAATKRDGEAFVFGSTATRPFTSSNVRRKAVTAWKAENKRRAEREEKLGDGTKLGRLDPILLHDARHSFVSLMHAAGLSLEEIGDYVGHSSTYMTDAYRHLIEGAEEAAAKRFEDYLRLANTHDRIAQLEEVPA